MSATVHLLRLSCEETEDSGDDEILLIYDGEVLGSQGLGVGDHLEINMTRPVNGTSVVDVQEEDWPDDNDFLGRIAIRESEKGQGMRQQTFTLDDAHYTLHYRVL